jgi:hypothetical protein
VRLDEDRLELGELAQSIATIAHDDEERAVAELEADLLPFR